MNTIGNEKVFEGMHNVTILVGFKYCVLDNDELKWHKLHKNSKERYLTLKEIYQQLKEKGYEGVIYVWIETPLGGTIYQCGNYEEGQWIKHGNTRGYA